MDKVQIALKDSSATPNEKAPAGSLHDQLMNIDLDDLDAMIDAADKRPTKQGASEPAWAVALNELFGGLEDDQHHMGALADLRMAYLKECRPKFYKELKAAGALRDHCLERERQALENKRRLLATGMNEDQADEIVRAEVMDQG